MLLLREAQNKDRFTIESIFAPIHIGNGDALYFRIKFDHVQMAIFSFFEKQNYTSRI
jgi:antirestriction protein ArdC